MTTFLQEKRSLHLKGQSLLLYAKYNSENEDFSD
jgi:hypothetical protein